MKQMVWILVGVSAIFGISACGLSNNIEFSSQAESLPLLSLWEATETYPIRIQIPGEKILQVYEITDWDKGFLMLSNDAEMKKKLYYCAGDSGVYSLMDSSFPTTDFTAGITREGLLQIITQEKVSFWNNNGCVKSLEMPAHGKFDFSYNYPRNEFFWVDPLNSDLKFGSLDGKEFDILWEAKTGENITKFPSIDDQGCHVTSRATAPQFSASGRLAIFSELSNDYRIKPILWDLDTGEHWECEEILEEPALTMYLVGEQGIITCYSSPGKEGWNSAYFLSLAEQEEIILDFSYVYSYKGWDCLFLEDTKGNLYRMDLETKEGVLHYKAETRNVKIQSIVESCNFEAFLFVETSLSNPTVVAIRPKF